MVLVSKESFKVSGLVGVGQICDVVGDLVSGLSRFDVRVKLLDVHDGNSLEDGDIQGGCLKGQCQLFVNKNWTEIVRIYRGIVAASLLRVDIPLSSQSVGFGTKLARAEMDDEVKLQQIFRPLDLSSGEEFGSRKIFEIFVVGNDIDWRSQTFEVVSSNFEGFEDHK